MKNRLGVVAGWGGLEIHKDSHVRTNARSGVQVSSKRQLRFIDGRGGRSVQIRQGDADQTHTHARRADGPNEVEGDRGQGLEALQPPLNRAAASSLLEVRPFDLDGNRSAA